MKALLQQRLSIAAASRAAGVFATIIAASVAQGQSKNPNVPPDPSSPRLLITTFRMAPGTKPVDGKLGAEMAAALRDRISSIIDERQLWVVPRAVINQTLSTSGYQPDSALQPNDIVALGRISQIGANETIDGVLSRLPNGDLELAPKFYYNNKLEVVEPFAPITGKTTIEIAKSWAETYKGMRKEIPEFKKCETSLANSKGDSAAVYGRSTIAMYPNSMIGRLCLITAFDKIKAPADSTIRVGLEILARDTTSAIALDYLRLAYEAKGDLPKASEYAVKIFRLDPGNQGKAQTVINAMVNSGSPQSALPIVDTLIASNPGDKEPYITKLKILLKMNAYKEAFKTADEVVKIDTSVATLDFYRQMVGAAQLDSNQAMQLQYLAKATQKFPREAQLQIAYATELTKAGQLQQAVEAARRGVDADPRVPNGMITVVLLYSRLNQIDSAYAFGKRALAAGADSARIAGAMLATLTPALNAAQTSAARADWETLYHSAAKLDSIIPGQGTKFFTGFAAGNIGIAALQKASDLSKATPVDVPAVCTEATIADDMFTLAQASMSGGGGAYQPASAAAIMQNVTQYNQIPTQMMAQLHCPKK